MSDDNPFNTGYYCETELRTFGFKAVGRNVRIAKNCTIAGLHNISIGDNVIIDAFCSIIATGGELKLGTYIHIGAFCHLLANDGIEIKDFSGLSQGVKIYSKTDDYSGNSLTNPTIPSKYKKLKAGKVLIGEHVIIGANSIVLPNLTIGDGVAVGALSLVSTSLSEWNLYFGNPLKRVAPRSRNLLAKKDDFLKATGERS
ncbi:acyltransferase [Robiginitalea marina]|uniref:Chloramphenicol acetyltransferase n=1 Tax=Robiginitalea marina TaxID=2954105 RepID=A0ABT1AUT6_9FLAO|nr:acyltransferase [Robiginitalea marina]MCO5723320.1 acyltransferase [Robiginitalea marina]